MCYYIFEMNWTGRRHRVLADSLDEAYNTLRLTTPEGSGVFLGIDLYWGN